MFFTILMEESFDAGNLKPPEQIGSTLAHTMFSVFTYIESRLIVISNDRNKSQNGLLIR